MVNSSDNWNQFESILWIGKPTIPGIWKRRLRWLSIPLTNIAVYEDMDVLVWVTSLNLLDPEEFTWFYRTFFDYSLVRKGL